MNGVIICLQGAFWGLMVGLVIGLTRMIIEFAYPPPRCGVYDPRPSVLRNVHYLHFAIILCLLTGVVVVVISLLTDPPTEEQVSTFCHTGMYTHTGVDRSTPAYRQGCK